MKKKSVHPLKLAFLRYRGQAFQLRWRDAQRLSKLWLLERERLRLEAELCWWEEEDPWDPQTGRLRQEIRRVLRLQREIEREFLNRYAEGAELVLPDACRAVVLKKRLRIEPLKQTSWS